MDAVSEDSAELRERIHSAMCRMSQNISTTECLMHGLRSKEDLDEVKGKLSEAANALEILIPLLQQYMAQQEPENEDAKHQFWLERERINRDLESSLKDYHMINLVLDNCNNVSTAKHLAKTLIDLRRPTKRKLSEIVKYDKTKEPNGLTKRETDEQSKESTAPAVEAPIVSEPAAIVATEEGPSNKSKMPYFSPNSV